MQSQGQINLRGWQTNAYEKWLAQDRRGIIAVVTGGGKTIFALHCLKGFRASAPSATCIIVVPTEALLDQWAEEIITFLQVPLDHLVILSTHSKIRPGRIHIGVINTVAELAERIPTEPVFLIVDECHRAASPVFQKIFDIKSLASLGLSATPERQYDTGLDDILIPKLGPIIFRYTYREALADGVIVPFTLHNLVFEFDPEEQSKYDKATRAIQIAVKKYGPEAPETISLYIKRTRISNISLTRVRIALKLVVRHRRQRILIFHEDIAACELIHQILQENKVSSGVYHSRAQMAERIKTLSDYRQGKINVLVSCRALDEGFNVPETEIGIIAASTATHRQRVQRLGRILRPAPGKDQAEIYSIVAAPPEIRRLSEEAIDMEGLAEVTWHSA